MSTATTSVITFAIDRVALRGLADLTDKCTSGRFPGMACVRVWASGSKVYAAASDGRVAGIWHHDEPGTENDFCVYIPAAIAKTIAKIGKKRSHVLIEIDGEIVKGSAGGESVSRVVNKSVLYGSLVPPLDRFLQCFRPVKPLSLTIPNIGLEAFSKFGSLVKDWCAPALRSQSADEKLPIFLEFPGNTEFVGILMGLSREDNPDIEYQQPEWLTSLVNES
jgi:hypothetical protein